MKPPPNKPDQQRMPFNAPPSSESLASRGLALMKTKRGPKGEDGKTALARAKTMPWSDRIVREEPYMSGQYWCWVCRL
jgi:hypothetical protein